MAKESVKPMTKMADRDDDTLLVERVQAGDMAAFSRLVVKYQDRILNTCWRLIGDLDDARDLTQEAFLRAMQSINSFQYKASFYTWLFRIAVNLSISHRRKSARQAKLSLHQTEGSESHHQASDLVDRMASDEPEPNRKVSARETQDQVARALDELEDAHRILIVLRDIENFDYQQISEILSLPVGTVKSRIHRARMSLRDRLRPILDQQ
jgi:RNA polymerase sigma-70 factor (ECF subfamily)